MISKPKGTYDVLPNESSKWQYVEGRLKRVANLYNFKEVRMPIFEHSELFHRGIGDTSDIVTKETYDFVDRGDRKITLRPEGTAGVVRMFVENKLYANQNVNKLYYYGPSFRYERPQKGRYRQFNQFGVEALGSSSPYLDVEVISFAVTALEALGLKGVKVNLNTIGDQESRDKYRGALVSYFTQYQDELCADCKVRLEKNPLRILDCKIDNKKPFFAGAPKINDYLNEESKAHFNQVIEALEKANISYFVNLNLVRGLDYYCHTVFELEAQIESLGGANVVGGGGRYDNLVSDLEGPKTPCVGMAFGVDRLLAVMDSEGLFENLKDKIHLYLITLGDKARLEANKILFNLRMGGIICDTDYMGRGLKGQFKQADSLNSRFTAILGDDELEKGTINVKDNSNDNQETIELKDLYKYLVERLNSGCNGCPQKK